MRNAPPLHPHHRLPAVTQAHNLVEYPLRNFPLGRLRNLDDLVLRNDGHFIAIGVEADAFAGDVVDYDGIELLGSQLLTCVFEDVLGFCGETHDNLRLLAKRNFLEDIGGRLKFQSDWPFAFDLLRRG